MRNQRLWICWLLAFLPAWTNGQADDPGKKDGRSAWIMATSLPADLANPLTVLSGEELHEVRIHLRMVNQSVPVDRTGSVRVVQPVTGPDGEILYEDLSRSLIPEGVREALIVLVPNDDKNGLRFHSRVIDLAKFRKGGCLYVNLVNTKIGITIGDQKTVIHPGGMEFINPLEREARGVFPIRFFYEIESEEDRKWKLMTSSKMPVYESRREICVFFYNKDIGDVDFRGVPFITPRPLPEQQ